MSALGVAAGMGFVSTQLAIAGWLAYVAELRMRRRIEASHARERATWEAQLDKLAKSVHYGQPSTPPAVVLDAEPTIEERATRAFGQEAIAAGMIRMRDEYKALGVHLDDAALREEVISMLFGSPVPSIPLLVKDG